jgi:hypothetical protein
LLAVAGGCALVAAMVASVQPVALFIVLVMTGVAWLAMGTVETRREWVLPAVGVLGLAEVVRLVAFDGVPMEACSVPLGAVVAGLGWWRRRDFVGYAAGLALVPSAVVAFDDPGLIRPVTVVVAAAGVLAVGLWRRSWLLLSLAGGVFALLGVGLVVEQRWAVMAGLMGAMAVVLASRSVLDGRDRVWAAPTAALAATAGVGAALAAVPVAPGPAGVVLSGVGVAWMGLSIVRAGQPEAVRLLGAAGTSAVVGARVALAEPAWLSVVLALTGVAWLGFASRPGQGRWSAPAVVVLSAAVWLRLDHSGVEQVEPYTLPFACLLLLVGVVWLVRSPATSSWLTVGAPVVIGLVPSAFVGIASHGALRSLVVAGVAAATLIVGLRLRLQAVFVPSALSLIAVTLAQLAPYAVGAPRWLTIGTLGVLLLVTGITYERRLGDARALRAWLISLR